MSQFQCRLAAAGVMGGRGIPVKVPKGCKKKSVFEIILIFDFITLKLQITFVNLFNAAHFGVAISFP